MDPDPGAQKHADPDPQHWTKRKGISLKDTRLATKIIVKQAKHDRHITYRDQNL
jgi:hypothetical protein